MDIDVPNVAPELFIDASIERVEGIFGTDQKIDKSKVTIMLSNTISGQNQVTLIDYLRSSIRDASGVIIIDEQEYPLLLDSFDYLENLEFIVNGDIPTETIEIKVPFYYYKAPDNLPYELEKEYLLKIDYQGVTYRATATIPSTRKVIDSIFYEEHFFFEKRNWVELFVATTDPADEQNFIRSFVSINSSIRNSFYRFFPTAFRFGSITVEDDLLDNGISTVENEVPKSANRVLGACVFEFSQIQDIDDDEPFDQESFRDQCKLHFTLGDTVYYKMSSISQSSYDYLNTQAFSVNSLGNPFSQPIRVNSTFTSSSSENGVVGTFIGYRSFIYKTIADTSKVYVY